MRWRRYGASHGAPIYGELTDASFLEFLSLLQHRGERALSLVCVMDCCTGHVLNRRIGQQLCFRRSREWFGASCHVGRCGAGHLPLHLLPLSFVALCGVRMGAGVEVDRSRYQLSVATLVSLMQVLGVAPCPACLL